MLIALFGAIGALIAIALTNSRARKGAILLLALLALLAIACAIAAAMMGDSQDRCLDAGGSWSKADGSCTGAKY